MSGIEISYALFSNISLISYFVLVHSPLAIGISRDLEISHRPGMSVGSDGDSIQSKFNFSSSLPNLITLKVSIPEDY